MRTLLAVFALAVAGRSLRAQQPPQVPSGPLSLVQVIRLGRERGVNAALARINERIAGARVGQHRADLLPSISGGASITRQTLNLDEFGIPIATGVTPAFDIWRFQVRAAQTIFDASLISRLRAARDTAAAAGLDAQAVGELAGATAGLAYLRVLSAEETVRARESDSTVAASLLSQSRQLVQAGVNPVIDATRSEVSFASVRTQLELARNTLDRSRLDLLRTLDLPSNTRLALADTLGVAALAVPLNADSAAAYAESHRAELSAERARTTAARRNLQSIRFEYLPNLSVNGAYIESGRTLGGARGTYNVQLLLNVPILDGWRRQSRSREQSARVEAQELRERDLANQIETEARQAVLDLSSAQQQVTIAAERVQLAEQELSQAEERLRAGVAGTIETTNAQGSEIAARDALIQARVNYGTARVSAYRALGVIDQLQ
jgi:outer membrane protein TolC